LNRLFEGSAREQHNHGQRAGQVNVGALYRHSFDDAVFSRRQEEEGIDTALYILIDVSGSTGNRLGDRNGLTIYQAEFAAAHAIIDALRGANVQIAVDAFASYIAQIADWGAGIAKFKSNHAHAYGAAGGGTDDYAAVRHAHKRLLSRPEKRKVLLVFTDGKGREDKVREQAEVGTNLGITTIGIGIGVNVGGVYPQSVYVDNISELASVSLKQIKLAA
jgi:cobalamin biosynthesis protein CobT